MSRSSREVEVKLPFETAESARRALTSIGAIPVGERYFEDNIVFDREGTPLRAAGRMLRLRRAAGRAVLTLKEPVPGEYRHKVRQEEEVDVDDADTLSRILEALDFRPFYRYQKYRTGFRLGELLLLLDETPVGCFLELEGPAEAIDHAAAALGFSREAFVLDTYREIHERRAREQGVEVGDLIFEAPAGEPPR